MSRFFDTLDEVQAWLRKKEGNVSTDKSSKFCLYSYNHYRCGLPPHGLNVGHITYRDDRVDIFGDEAYVPKQHFSKCTKWSAVESLGQCQLPFAHAGDHNFEDLNLKERCNVWSSAYSLPCSKPYGHTGAHDYRATKDIAVALPKATRACRLTPGCSGTMTASFRWYTAATYPMLFWCCESCHKQVSYANGRVILDPRPAIDAEAAVDNVADIPEEELTQGATGTAKFPPETEQSPTAAKLVADEIKMFCAAEGYDIGGEG